MATIINNPSGQSSDDGVGIGLIIGILLVILMAILFYIYGLPALQNTDTEQQPTSQKIEIQLPVVTPEPKPTP